MVNIEELKTHFDGDEELIGELVEVFEETYPETLSSVKLAIEGQNFSDLELHAHTLKGMIANFFAAELKNAAFELEKMGKNQQITGCDEFVNLLERDLPLLVQELRSLG